MSDDTFNQILDALSYFKSILKYDRIYPNILLHGKSAYIEGEHIKGKVEFFNREFDELVTVPFGKAFEFSETPRDMTLTVEVDKINKLARNYCDTLFYIDKNSIIDFMDKNYNSSAKLNKILMSVIPIPEPRLNFKPVKKSTSVFESEYLVDTTKRIYNNFRLGEDSVAVNALLFHEAIKSSIFTDILKIEISKRKFIRVSCVNNEISVKFIICEKKT